MKYIFGCITIWFLCGIGILTAQTPAQVQQLFENKQFAEVKPLLKNLLQKASGNVRYNYMYGAACVETGAYDEAIPYLRKANPKRQPEVHAYLAKALQETYRFDEAVTAWEGCIAWQTKKKQNTDVALAALERAKKGGRMLRNVEEILVVDSIVVEKTQLLRHLFCGKDIGKIAWASDDANRQRTAHVNDWGDKELVALADDNGNTGLYARMKQFGAWSEPEPIASLNKNGTQVNFPFLSPDGVTLYFASDDKEGMGGYDIYVTRYDAESGSYLKAENLGFPFNSPFNDYLYIVNEEVGVGWFVSDRYQPEGMTCIYVFVANKNRKVYDYDTTPLERLTALARLLPISVTQHDKAALAEAQKNIPQETEEISDFSRQESWKEPIVINDKYRYWTVKTFSSREAAKLVTLLKEKEKLYDEQKTVIERLREKYHAGDIAVGEDILSLEAEIRQLGRELDKLRLEVIRLEQEKINR